MASKNGKTPLTWSNDSRKLSDLIPWERNPRFIEDDDAARLDESLTDFNQADPLLIGPNNELYDGHQRLDVWSKSRGADFLVDVRVSNRPLTEKEREKLTIIREKSKGQFDFGKLATWDLGDLLEWGFDEAELDFAAPAPVGTADAEPQIGRAAELQEKWATATGQLWAIGDHRLLVGDSTKREDVERVMGEECAEMVWTDPPYGVSVGDKNKFLNSIARSNRIEENLENDTLPEPELVAMLCNAFDNALDRCLAGAAWYVAAPPGPLHVLFGQVLKDRGVWRQTIQWVKNNATFAPLGVDYHWRAEPIFYGWKPGAAHRYYGGRQQDTVWEIDRPMASPEHPTMKPIELVQRAIANSSQNSDIVLDPFAGSGTTLVSCQNLNRRGRAIEISPAYCAVILERMITAFPDIDIYLVDYIEYTPQPEEDKVRQNEVAKEDVPDALFPTDNEFGIPVLRLDMQSDFVDLPALKWGQYARGRKHAGTYHFYTDDYKFSALWADPTPVINSGCPSVVEVNYSIHEQTPKVLVMDSIYKKRWLSRYWQENGVKVFVDLGVPPDLLDTCCLGVPDGWRAFATRVYESDNFEDDLTRQHERAVSIRGGDDVMFVVFGKSERIRAYCAERHWEFVKTISF